MSLINAGDLAYMRATINEMLPDTCSLLTLSQTSDGQGGYTETWGTAAGGTAVACRVDYLNGDERVFGNTLTPYTGWIVTLPYNKTVTEQYRIQHGGTLYNVTDVDSGKSWQASVRVAVEKV